LAEQLNIDDFKASEGWLGKFKQRHSIIFKSVQGEAAQIDHDSLNDWQQKVLRSELARFSPNDVYNVDETGLFFHLLPDKTLSFKG
jgi:hypothetical protein